MRAEPAHARAGYAHRPLQDNPDVGFVQARWVYANGSESLLTRVQEISLNYHIKARHFACAVMRAPACRALASGVSDVMWSMCPALRARCQCEQYARFASGTYCRARISARPC
jgi:hypothetical protein